MASPSFLPTRSCQLEETLTSLLCGSFRRRSFDVASRLSGPLGPLIAVVLLIPLGAGCASRASVRRAHGDLAVLQSSVAELRQAQAATSQQLVREAAEHRALQTKTAEIEAALKQAREDIGRLRTRVEAAEARAAKALVTPPAPTPAVAPAAPPAAPVPAPAPAPPPLSIPRSARVNPLPPAPATAPAPRTDRPREAPGRTQTPEQTYAAALAMFRAREHGQAVLDFLDFMAKYPGHPLVANAQYWIGEAYYVQRDYRQAQAEFQKVTTLAPASAKAADALLKIGLCQRSLRYEPHARQTWQHVVHEYPQSEAAIKARAFLRPEGGSARH